MRLWQETILGLKPGVSILFSHLHEHIKGLTLPGAGLGDSGDSESMRMHEYLLSGFGLPIGELFDLKALSEQCKVHNRWSFFISSEPLNLVGGVGSPPNAVAIF